MKALVLFDTRYGNTEAIAKAIGSALGEGTPVTSAASAGYSLLQGVELVIVGSPTHGGRPTPAVAQWLKGLPSKALDGVRVAAFDTRIATAQQALWLRLVTGVIGYAAPRIAASLRGKGGRLVAEPEGFAVERTEGPLRPGEADRAVAWATALAKGD